MEVMLGGWEECRILNKREEGYQKLGDENERLYDK
jgi:hypothetical protein